MTLAEARAKAFEYRKMARAGNDPTKLHPDGIPTFSAGRRSRHCPTCGQMETRRKIRRAMAVQPRHLRDTAARRQTGRPNHHRDVMACLAPIWTTKAETAKRVRQRISAIMKWAIAEGHRTNNPAGDAVTAALPKQNGGKKHHRAMPHRQVGDALVKVRKSGHPPMVRLAYEFLVLTAARSSEVRGAVWSEIDLDTATWVIPAQRMKAAREHRVPLSGAAIQVLAEARRDSDGSNWVFPAQSGGEIPSWVLTKLPTRLNLGGTLHGMRSSFRDWCGEEGVAREVAEACLAHRIGTAAEQAIRTQRPPSPTPPTHGSLGTIHQPRVNPSSNRSVLMAQNMTLWPFGAIWRIAQLVGYPQCGHIVPRRQWPYRCDAIGRPSSNA